MKSKFTHIVIDERFHNFKIGTEVFILQDLPEYELIVISDGKFVKMCGREQLKLKEDFE